MAKAGQSRSRQAPRACSAGQLLSLRAASAEEQAVPAPPATRGPRAAGRSRPAAAPRSPQPIGRRPRRGSGWPRPIGILEGGGTSLTHLTPFLSLLEEKFGTSAAGAAKMGEQRVGRPRARLQTTRARLPGWWSPGSEVSAQPPSSSHPRASSQVPFLPYGLSTHWLSRETSFLLLMFTQIPAPGNNHTHQRLHKQTASRNKVPVV